MRTSHKMYLTFLLSSACIFVYQYHLSMPRLTQSLVINEVVSTTSTSTTLPTTTTTKQHTIPTTTQNTTNSTNKLHFLSPSNQFMPTNLNASKQSFASVSSSSSFVSLNMPSSLAALSVQTNTQNSLNSTRNPAPPPPLYIITPTYRRPEQLAEITRLGYTLKHVPNIYWLVIEDADKPTELVTKLLQKINVPFEHLVAQMPAKYRKNKVKPRGVSNRNRGLQWIRANATEGVLYFADDDNTYDLDIFDEMRYTKKVSMWPVGLITKYGVSSPIVKNGMLSGFYDGWIGGRKFPIDMAGFAVNVQFLHSRPNASMPFKPGYEEDGFLRSLTPLRLNEIELLASNCTEILTWHTQSKKNPSAMALDMAKYNDTNLVNLRQILV